MLFVRKVQDKQEVYTDNGGINGGINGSINEIETIIINMIKENPGIKAGGISQKISSHSKRSVERYIKELKDKGIITYKGSLKTGGYYFSGQ